MHCSFAIYCDKERATDIKIHKVECSFVKSHEAHDDEWFYAPTYANAYYICKHLKKTTELSISDCKKCNPKPEEGSIPIHGDNYDDDDTKIARTAKNAQDTYEKYGV